MLAHTQNTHLILSADPPFCRRAAAVKQGQRIKNAKQAPARMQALKPVNMTDKRKRPNQLPIPTPTLFAYMFAWYCTVTANEHTLHSVVAAPDTGPPSP